MYRFISHEPRQCTDADQVIIDQLLRHANDKDQTGAHSIFAKRNAGARSDQPASLAVTVPITNLGEWVQVRDRLASVSSIRKIDLLSLSRQEARIEVKYVGSQDQLKSSLAEVNLDLGGGDPVWRIQSSGAASEH